MARRSPSTTPSSCRIPIDQRTNDVKIGASWANPKAMFHLGWDGSWFNNDIESLVWDNPIRITDFNNGLAPPLGPYDPSGYSNGNGSAQGRMALAPSNTHERRQRNRPVQDARADDAQRHAPADVSEPGRRI